MRWLHGGLAAIVSVIAAVGLSGCGRLADGDTDLDAPLGVIRASVTQLDPDRPQRVDGDVDLALFWRHPRSYSAMLDRSSPSNVADATPLSCVTYDSYVSPSCSGIAASGHDECTYVRSPEIIQAVDHQLRGLAFEVPLREVPIADGLYPLSAQGGTGTFGLAVLRAFVDVDHDGRLRYGTPRATSEPVVADSAYREYAPANGKRRSYLVAFLGGRIALDRVRPEFAEVLRSVPEGFSLWIEDEWIDAYGRPLVYSRRIASISDAMELAVAPDLQHARAWCEELSEETRHVNAIPAEYAPLSCSGDGKKATWRSSRWKDTCTYETTVYEGDYSCAPGVPAWSCPAEIDGLLQVSVATTSSEPSGPYVVSVDDRATAPVQTTGRVTLGISAGLHSVRLGGLPSNCSVHGENPVSVDGVRGGVASAQFEVRCVSTTRLRITTVTTGTSPDDAYVLTGPGFSTTIGANESRVLDFGPAQQGWMTLNVGDIAWNCAAGEVPGQSRDVSVWLSLGQLSELLVPVRCNAGGRVQVTTTTSGAYPDPDGFALELTGPAFGPWQYPIASNGAITVGDGSVPAERLRPGTYRARLTGVAPNCRAVPGEVPVDVLSGQTTDVAFVVVCDATSLRITTVTNGASVDDGYSLTGPTFTSTIGPNESILLDLGPSGDESVTVNVGDIAWNCTVGDVPGASRDFVVSLVPGQLNELVIPVVCEGFGRIRVNMVSSGAIPITGRFIALMRGHYPSWDWGPFYYQAPANGAVTIGDGTSPAERLLAGRYVLSVVQTPGCVYPNQGPIEVLPDATTEVTWEFACDPPTTLRISTTTTGANRDDGYDLTVTGLRDEVASFRLGANASILIDPIWSLWRSGANGLWYTVTVGDVGWNCSTDRGPLPVWVELNKATEVVIPVQCTAAGRIRVTTSTVGDEPDPDGFRLLVSGGDLIRIGPTEYPLPSSGTIMLGSGGPGGMLPVGTYEARLSGIAKNCDASPLSATFEVFADATTDVPFDVRCSRAGGVQVTAATSGTDVDPNGYRVELTRLDAAGPSESVLVAVNGAAAIQGLHAGTYRARLTEVAPNCTVSPPEVTLAVVAGETADVAFAVECAPVADTQIAFSGHDLEMCDPGDPMFGMCPLPGEIYVVNSDGTGAMNLTQHPADDREPSWSPDGRIAFASDRGGGYDVYVMSADGSSVARLTIGGARQPAWSPDGSRIAFVSDRDGNAEIYLMNADGTQPVQLTDAAFGGPASAPAWSPDGTRIAFARASRIYLMNADGTGVSRLRQEKQPGWPYDESDPDWSPDGSTIAFAEGSETNGAIVLVTVADGSETVVASGAISGSDPSWSPNGRLLAYTWWSGDPYWEWYGAIVITGAGELVSQPRSREQPAWRR